MIVGAKGADLRRNGSNVSIAVGKKTSLSEAALTVVARSAKNDDERVDIVGFTRYFGIVRRNFRLCYGE